MIDDDSFMYPDCAAQVMAVYDADKAERLVCVGAMERAVSPLSAEARPEGGAHRHGAAGARARRVVLPWPVR